jgi:hypothetical protein
MSAIAGPSPQLRSCQALAPTPERHAILENYYHYSVLTATAGQPAILCGARPMMFPRGDEAGPVAVKFHCTGARRREESRATALGWEIVGVGTTPDAASNCPSPWVAQAATADPNRPVRWDRKRGFPRHVMQLIDVAQP